MASRGRDVPAVSCDVCGKPTSRLLGFGAVIRLPQEDEDAQALTRFRSSARGFCLAHKDQIAPRFLADALAEGEVVWQAPEPVPLRPAEVPRFQEDMEDMALEVGASLGLNLSNLRREIHLNDGEDGGTNLPKQCPHCSGRISWGTGPHVRDARERAQVTGFAEAWECLDCRAAGVLAGTPPT